MKNKYEKMVILRNDLRLCPSCINWDKKKRYCKAFELRMRTNKELPKEDCSDFVMIK